MRSRCGGACCWPSSRPSASTDKSAQRRLLTFVVVGAGPTGVELAGALAEISRHALAHDFRDIDPESARVILVEGGPAVLPTYPADLSAFARRALERLGVAVWTGSIVTNVTPGEVHVGSEVIQAGTILWAAGVSASALGKSLGAPMDRAGPRSRQRRPHHSGPSEVFVVGRSRRAQGQGREVAARRRAGRDSAGRDTPPETCVVPSPASPHAVRVPQLREPRDDRPQLRGRRSAALQDDRISGVAVLAVRAHRQAHRVPQPACPS